MKNVRYYAVKSVTTEEDCVILDTYIECGSWIGAYSAAKKRGWSVVKETTEVVTLYEGY